MSSQIIPADWIFEIGTYDIITITPKIWKTEGFLDDLIEELTYAVEIFCEKATLIYQEEGKVFPITPAQFNRPPKS